MEFRSQSNYRVPILTDLIEGLRNELITTFVSGTLLDPDFSTEVLPGTRQAIDEMFEGDQGGQHNLSSPIQRSTGAEGVSSVPYPDRPRTP